MFSIAHSKLRTDRPTDRPTDHDRSSPELSRSRDVKELSSNFSPQEEGGRSVLVSQETDGIAELSHAFRFRASGSSRGCRKRTPPAGASSLEKPPTAIPSLPLLTCFPRDSSVCPVNEEGGKREEEEEEKVLSLTRGNIGSTELDRSFRAELARDGTTAVATSLSARPSINSATRNFR